MGLFLVQTDKDMFINLLLIIAIKLQKGKIRLDGLMIQFGRCSYWFAIS